MTAKRCVLVSASGFLLAFALSGCTYDYLQNSDRVGYHAGDAVKANLATSTTDPSSASNYNKKGLGKDGNVIPDDSGSATGMTPPPANP